LYIYARLTNAGTTEINGIAMSVTFPAQNGEAPTTITSAAEGFSNSAAQPLATNSLPPNESRNIRIPIEHVPPSWNQQLPELKVQDSDLSQEPLAELSWVSAYDRIKSYGDTFLDPAS
jgi:hypothetical protein